VKLVTDRRKEGGKFYLGRRSPVKEMAPLLKGYTSNGIQFVLVKVFRSKSISNLY
jgi:hypothetical protein